MVLCYIVIENDTHSIFPADISQCKFLQGLNYGLSGYINTLCSLKYYHNNDKVLINAFSSLPKQLSLELQYCKTSSLPPINLVGVAGEALEHCIPVNLKYGRIQYFLFNMLKFCFL